MENFKKNESFKSVQNFKLVLILLVSFSLKVGQAQEMYLKSVTHINLLSDTVFMVEECHYDANWKLDSITYSPPYGARTVKSYSNDTLISEITPEYAFEYIYYSDSVIRYNTSLNQVDRIHYKDSFNREISCNTYKNGNLFISYYYTWENENAVYFSNSQNNGMSLTYHPNILNPRYKANTVLKFGTDGLGSVNYISGRTVPAIPIEEFYIVEEAINSYPKVVSEYILTGPPSFRFVFDYHVIVGIQNNPWPEGTVQSVKYYNILGQEIEMPRHGFYVERTQTTKGITTKKCFMR